MTISKLAGRLFDNWPVKILCFAAAVLLFMFYHLTNLSERFFSVPLQLRLGSALAPASEFPQRVRVSLKGDEDKVFAILEEDITAFVDLGRETGEGMYRLPVMVRRRATAQNADSLEIRVDPDVITLNMERKVSRKVKVNPATRSQPAAGFSLERIQVNPATVTIEGPRSRVQKINSVSTEEIELGNKQENFTARARLAKPDPLVQLPGVDAVEIRVEIRESAGRAEAEMGPEGSP